MGGTTIWVGMDHRGKALLQRIVGVYTWWSTGSGGLPQKSMGLVLMRQERMFVFVSVCLCTCTCACLCTCTCARMSACICACIHDSAMTSAMKILYIYVAVMAIQRSVCLQACRDHIPQRQALPYFTLFQGPFLTAHCRNAWPPT